MRLRADGALQTGLPPTELTAAAHNSSLQWLPGQNGTVNISFPLTAMGHMLQQGVLVLHLENVTNADLSAEQDTCLISELPQENLTVVLAMQPNQVPILAAAASQCLYCANHRLISSSCIHLVWGPGCLVFSVSSNLFITLRLLHDLSSYVAAGSIQQAGSGDSVCSC